jgi:hypothetical protein
LAAELSVANRHLPQPAEARRPSTGRGGLGTGIALGKRADRLRLDYIDLAHAALSISHTQHLHCRAGKALAFAMT